MKHFAVLFRSRVGRVRSGRRVRGFTLLELMVAIACITILAATATPTLRQYLRMVNLRQAVYQISGDLHMVKSQAIKTSANCSVTFNFDPGTYMLSSPNRIMDLNTYRGQVAFTANPDPGGLPADDFSPAITFNSRGLSGLDPPATTQVYVTNQDNRIFRVQVTATGAISVRIWDGHSNAWAR